MDPNNILRLKDMIDTHFKKINDLTKPIKSNFLIPSERIESEIVIVCHCSEEYQDQFTNNLHEQLYYIKDNKLDGKVGKDVKYVDENKICKHNKWSNIDDKSKMYIWGLYCPISYSHFKDNWQNKVLTDILTNSLRKLKQNGKVFFPHFVYKETNSNTLNKHEKTLNYFQENNFDGFTFTLESIDKFPYIIDKKLQTNRVIENYYVFTKN